MKFGARQTADCVGDVLAHGLTLATGRLKKGHILTQADIDAAVEVGIETLAVAQLETEDVLENAAAEQIGRGLTNASVGVQAKEAFTGRVNLHADGEGLFTANRQQVDAINRIDPAITLATLPDGTRVQNGRMVATVKIIPLAVPGCVLERVMEVISVVGAFRMHALHRDRVWLIQTELDTVKTSVLDKTARVLKTRLDDFGAEIVEERRVPHQQGALEQALRKVRDAESFDASRDVIVVFGASAIADEADVIPAALSRLGMVDYFGMPVDPGNLLMVGSVDNVPVIGAPGCARSSAENGFDWVLERVLHDAPVDGQWISGLGVGGLLMEIHDRPQPREG